MTSVDRSCLQSINDLLLSGHLNRYQSESNDQLVQAETALAQYIGRQYCIGVNSCGSAIYLALRALGVCSYADENGMFQRVKVFTNAFSFNAVPSAIAHAGGECVLVDTTPDFLIDLDDLRHKAMEPSIGARILVLSYMRGRVPDMDKVLEICDEFDIQLIEDSAHAYGCEWKKKKIGSFGRASCISTQANKVINSGEGGFLLTNDPDIMAYAITAAGCYESLYTKHKAMCPPVECIEKYRTTVPNCSLRMTNLIGLIVLPQIQQIDSRRDQHNAIYHAIVKTLGEDQRIWCPPQSAHITPVYDSLQFVVHGISSNQSQAIVTQAKQAKIPLAVFGHAANARNYLSWEFVAPDRQQVPNTSKVISCAFDTRLSLNMTLEEGAELGEKLRNIVTSVCEG